MTRIPRLPERLLADLIDARVSIALDKRVDKRIDRRLKELRKELKQSSAKLPPAYPYEADGLATRHRSPFLEDAEFSALYEQIAAKAWADEPVDVRWRVWLLTRFVRQCHGLAGNLAEFGTYRGGYAFMILGTARLEPSQRLFLFDTFAGIPADNLTEAEEDHGFAGRLADTSPERVNQLLSRWEGRYTLCEGDVFETLPRTDTGNLSFAHMDLNASAPTHAALEYAYPRLEEGGIMLFDDYGWTGYEDQRTAIEAFFADKAEEVLSLPTGQGVMIRRRG